MLNHQDPNRCPCKDCQDWREGMDYMYQEEQKAKKFFDEHHGITIKPIVSTDKMKVKRLENWILWGNPEGRIN